MIFCKDCKYIKLDLFSDYSTCKNIKIVGYKINPVSGKIKLEENHVHI